MDSIATLGSVNPALLAQFDDVDFKKWRKGVYRWFSTTQPDTDAQLTENYVQDDWLGYLTTDGSKIEIEKLGSEIQYTGTENIINEPYPSRLRPLDDFSKLRQMKHVIIHQLQFYAFDAIKIGSSEQDAGVNTEITNSLTSANNAYVQSRFLYNMPVTWLPNWFRPKFKVNGLNLLESYERTALFNNSSTRFNKADLGIGEMLPYCIELDHYVDYAVNTIEVSGVCGQYVTTGGNDYVKRYPILCRASILYHEG